MNNFEQNIQQVDQHFKNVFKNLNITKNFVREFVKSQELTATSLTTEQIDEINKGIAILIENAKVTETRKEQQKYFLPLFTKMDTENFIKCFDDDEKFRLMFVQLLIVFLDKNNLHDKDAEHHINLGNQIKKAANLI